MARYQAQERARRLRQGQPGLEIGLDAERVGLVVAEHRPLVAGENDGAVEAGGPERVVEPLIEDREVGAIFAREPRFELLARGERGVGIRRADGQGAAQVRSRPTRRFVERES